MLPRSSQDSRLRPPPNVVAFSRPLCSPSLLVATSARVQPGCPVGDGGMTFARPLPHHPTLAVPLTQRMPAPPHSTLSLRVYLCLPLGDYALLIISASSFRPPHSNTPASPPCLYHYRAHLHQSAQSFPAFRLQFSDRISLQKKSLFPLALL